MNNYTIYIHKNKINGKVYIGQTGQDPKKRWDNFWHIILYQNLTQDQANILEQNLIKKYNSTNENFGYNIKAGGTNHSHSEETKRKIGQSNHIALQGRTWSNQQREKISEMFSGEGNPFYGKHHTEQTKRKISENRKNKCKGEDHPFYGKHHTQESIQKMSKNRQGKGGKRVLCINTSEIFQCMMDAARWCGLKNATSIGHCCMGMQKTSGKHPITKEKLKWRYVDE